jgi:class 3 adenylate cyclase/tetratricopeptide (TPR) repeat protein
MERLESFVAGSLLQRLHRPDHDLTAAACTEFRGAVLFVDISGYTALAEALCATGSNGVEQLGRTLDRAFRSYVRAVRTTGGEIACFAGDAFLAYWPADDGHLDRALRNAQETAGALHAIAGAGDSATPDPQPTLHIGLSAGDIWAARLGGGDRWQVLLAGAAVRQACSAAVRAAAGATEVAPGVGPLMASGPDAANDIRGAVAVADPTAALSLDLSVHVPRRVHDYVGEGYAAWIPQRRTICALFVRIDGLDDGPPDALSRYQAVITSLHVALQPYTGASGTLLLDDKGLVFTLCLGMPHDAHADDAVRAVRAGLAIRSEVSRLGLNCSIGVATGDGVCMPLGGPERRHYWSVGRFMHIAGRLMEAAGTGLLCTEAIADRVRRVVSLSPERPLTLKGVRWPVRVFRVHEAVAFEERPERLYGREDEEATFDQCLADFEQGRGTVLSVVGDAGIGKTTLVDYLRRTAERRGLRCLSGAAGSMEIAVAYAAWRPVFAKLLEPAPSTRIDTPDERRARLGDIRHSQLAPLVNAVVPGFLEETPLVQNLTGQARADATSTVLEEVLEAHATRRFVLILEDCHWMDSASWRLLLRVAQDFTQALIVVSSRPTTDVQEAHALRATSGFLEMRLAPLRPDAIALLVEAVLEGRSATPQLIGEIAQRSEGNPLFAREYSLLLTAHGDAPEPVDALVTSGPSPVDEAVPVTVQSLIASRLDALSPAEDLALKAASVLGDGFSVDLIARVYPGSHGDDVIDSLLASLAERQLLARAPHDASRFTFQHALIREVTYQQLTREQRCDLHCRVAETLEREHRADLRPHFATLAHHWSHAEVPDATRRYSDQAASQALAAGAFEEAERLLGACIRLARETAARVDTSDRIRWYRQMADARHGMGQLEPRSAAAHQALRVGGLKRPHSAVPLLAQAMVRFCRLNVRRGIPSAPAAGAETILDVARAFRHSAEVCYFNNDIIGMICDSVGAVAYASSLPPSAVLAGAAAELGGILSIAGLRRIGERILNRAIAMAEAADDQAAQAYAHMISCLYYIGLGDWTSAERSARRCQELCEPMDDRVNWTNAQAVRFWMSHYRSHEASALDAAQRLRDRAIETGNRQHRAWGLRCLAVCSLRRNEPAEAVNHLQAALECLGETAALNERIPTLGILALAQLRSGDVWSARATAKEGLAQVVNVKRPIGQSTLEGYSSLISVALDAWQEERSPEWRRASAMCLRVLRRYSKGFPVGEPRYHLHRGDFKRLAGALVAARRSYRRGEAAALRLGMPWETRRCQQALAELSGSRR